MNEPSNKGNFASLIVGVLLGALIPFGLQLYQDSIEQARKARAERAEHIERLMMASTNMVGEELRGVIAGLTILQTTQVNALPDLKALVPDMNSMAEMRTLSALYIPEVEPEVKQVMIEYDRLVKEISSTVSADLQQMRPGVTPQSTIKAVRDGVFHLKAVDALQEKLIVLSKQNRP